LRIRLEGCGVCASNLPVWEGRSWFTDPLAPGAPGCEGWGRIDAVGREVRGLAVEERVAVLSSHAYAAYDIRLCSAMPVPTAWTNYCVSGQTSKRRLQSSKRT